MAQFDLPLTEVRLFGKGLVLIGELGPRPGRELRGINLGARNIGKLKDVRKTKPWPSFGHNHNCSAAVVLG